MSANKKRITRRTFDKATARVQAALDSQEITKQWRRAINNAPGVNEEQVVAVVIGDNGSARIEMEVTAPESSSNSKPST